MSTAFLPLLENSTKTHKGFSGTIVNISSISGHIRISQGHFAYNSSKGAAIHLNKMLAAEIAKNGIKVCCHVSRRCEGLQANLLP
jgi:NAD(P)-dependent dehydrogenase (short-subunit alcohol dehydrogenase family)